MPGTFPLYIGDWARQALGQGAQRAGTDMAKPAGPNGRVTILDIARATGVSKSSVSRFLDDRSSPSNNPTALLVRRAAAELGYIRDASAANLRRGATGMIGVIVPRLTDTVMAMLYEALSRAASQRQRFTIVATTEDDRAANQQAVDRLLARGVDGLVLATTRMGDGLAQRLSDRGVRFVLALRTDEFTPPPSATTVWADFWPRAI